MHAGEVKHDDCSDSENASCHSKRAHASTSSKRRSPPRSQSVTCCPSHDGDDSAATSERYTVLTRSLRRCVPCHLGRSRRKCWPIFCPRSPRGSLWSQSIALDLVCLPLNKVCIRRWMHSARACACAYVRKYARMCDRVGMCGRRCGSSGQVRRGRHTFCPTSTRLGSTSHIRCCAHTHTRNAPCLTHPPLYGTWGLRGLADILAY